VGEIEVDAQGQGPVDVVLATVHEVVDEVRPGGGTAVVALDSRFEQDLGIDSITIFEIGARVEDRCGVRLSDAQLAGIDSPRDLVEAVVSPCARAALHDIRPGPARLTAPVRAPEEATTLTEALDVHVADHPQRTHIRLVADDHEEVVSYAELRREAGMVARGLLARGVAAGESVAIMLPTSRAYFATFLGILIAGAVPVPIYPPARASQVEDHLRRQSRILDNARAVMLVTVPEALRIAKLLRGRVESMRTVVAAAELLTGGPEIALAPLHAGDLALLQYTSGSTGSPKGVMLTHANLLANIRAMGEAAAVVSTDVFVSWLPLYHDMGLIGAWLGSLYHGIPLVVMSPMSFLVRPVRWLQTIAAVRGTISAAPNFGYELCLTKVGDPDLEGLDLSSWRLAFNGAEPVNAETIERFAERFAPHGLRREAIAPVYGLAEASVGLAFPPLGRRPVIDDIARDRLVEAGRAQPAEPGDPHPLRFVACGRALPGHAIRVVDTAGEPLGDRLEGRIEFRGPSATSGYLRNSDATRNLFRDGWLDTGDLGYVAAGDLYVTGRVKDIVIRAGRNLHPEALEAAVGSLAGIRRGRVAVFGATAVGAVTEQLVVLAETRRTDPATRAALRDRIVEVTADLLGVPPDDVVLARPGTVLKTSSGKIRRAASRDAYLRGELDASPGPPWWQLVRFAGGSTGPRLRRARRTVSRSLFALYAWSCLVLIAPVVWALVLVLPTRRARWSVVRRGVRTLIGATRTRLVVTGAGHLPPDQPLVVAANHSSVLDAFALVSVVPGAPRFVAASEYSRHAVLRTFLRRLGTEFVERADRSQSIAGAHRLLELTREGESLVIFPEGRLSTAPGLRPFHLGAFVAAAGVGCATVPIALVGTRSMLPPHSKLPRPGTIEVFVGVPMRAHGTDWHDVVKLRDDVRQLILAECREPDLAVAARVTAR
jgi:1-acyl-sn-glycerol-3-phosphate acyltransferase